MSDRAQEIAERRTVDRIVSHLWRSDLMKSVEEAEQFVAAEIEPHLAKHDRLVEAAERVKQKVEERLTHLPMCIIFTNRSRGECDCGMDALRDALEGE